MRLFLALILFFYTAFDACLAEAIAHQAANTVTIEKNTDVNTTINTELKNCHQSESEHSEDSQHGEVCHTCHSCHNWFGDNNDFIQLITLKETNSSYLFVLPRPDIQKIERPPIQN